MSKIAAFFDIDGTIYREGLITEVFKKIIKYELIEEDVWHNEVKPVYLKWDRREGDYDEYLLKMVDAYKQAILGVSKEHIDHVAQKVINQKGDRIYTFTRERMKWHKEQGHIVIAISGSPIELVSKMASIKWMILEEQFMKQMIQGVITEMLFRCGMLLVNKKHFVS